jgi:uncharacterized protein involved in high-affinity Fe2+ transport
VRERFGGLAVVVLILGGVAALLALNLNLKPHQSAGSKSAASEPAPPPGPSKDAIADVPAIRQPAGFREYPIGDEVERNGMLLKAVWLPPIQMDGMPVPVGADLIHLEADIHATEGNPNGFAKDEFVPYLVVRYTLAAADAKSPGSFKKIEGSLSPMVARDGMHYGATIEAPPPGRYTLTYAIEPPSAGGLGRHVDPATGVAPWWKPFEASFTWDFEKVAEPVTSR